MMSQFQHIHSFVRDEIAARDAQPAGVLAPSDYWKDYNAFSSYIRTLPDEELRFIRRHTWHLTGDNFIGYHFMGRRAREALVKEYEGLLPALDGFVPNEPPDGIGADTHYGRINSGILRYSLVLGDLRRSGHLDRTQPKRVLELGGGYGGLALMALQFNPKIAYLICDLEESLFIQGVFLAQALGTDRVKLLRGEKAEFEGMQPGNVYLLPQRRADSLEGARFDLAINQQSMQEMTPAQVARYCEILEKCAPIFYSCNRRKHGGTIPEDKGLITNLHETLAKRFQVLWDSTEHVPPLVRVCQRHNLVRKLVTAFIGKSFLPQGEAALRRFVYKTG